MNTNKKIALTLQIIGLTTLFVSAVYKIPLYWPVFGIACLLEGTYRLVLSMIKRGDTECQGTFAIVTSEKTFGCHGKGKSPLHLSITDAEKQVLASCELIGYGRVMQIASNAWREKAKEENQPDAGLMIGPHAGMVVPCGCEPGSDCRWCCGSGWLTKHVKSLKNS